MAYTHDGLVPNFSCWCSHSTKAKRDTNNGVKMFRATASIIMKQLEKFIEFIKDKPYTYRLKIEQQPEGEHWSRWLICPAVGYIEGENDGLHPIKNVEWIAINPIENRQVGRRVPMKTYDYTAEIIEFLHTAQLSFERPNDLVRILLKRSV